MENEKIKTWTLDGIDFVFHMVLFWLASYPAVLAVNLFVLSNL